METDKYVFFCGHKPNNLGIHIFSQWFPCTFTEEMGGVVSTYTSAEQYMMAHKALLCGDGEYYLKIMGTNDPAKIKKYGREINGFDEGIWNQHKFDIVTEGNRLKFGQNPQLMQRLLQTGNKTIAEAAHYDKVWGIGLSAADAVNVPEDEWPGQNLLGKALMKVRGEQ